jgi:hypothetical protein
VHEAERAEGAGVPHVELHLEVAGAEPLDDEVRVDMGSEHHVGRGVELADEPDERDLRVEGDLGLGVRGHRRSPV